MMRVSMIGQYTLDAFSAAIPRLMRDLAANDIHLLADINLYVTPKDCNDDCRVPADDGFVKYIIPK